MQFPKGPFEMVSVGIQTAQLVAEAQMVMTMRLLGMAGFWSMPPSENLRMVLEKPDAFVRSAYAASNAAMMGKRPDQVAEAAIKPLRHKTRANSRRLRRAGPR